MESKAKPYGARELFSEYPGIYCSTKEEPNVMRFRMKMTEAVEEEALRDAVRLTAERYPYYCVALQFRENGDILFTQNTRPLPVLHAIADEELGSGKCNEHMMAFSWDEDWITVDMFHAISDGDGIYHVIRTLLYYYCCKRYHVSLPKKGIRLAGAPIPEEEWADPLQAVEEAVSPFSPDLKPALNPLEGGPIKADQRKTVYSIAVSESDFLRFSSDLDGSPGTVVALFLSRAVARLFPDGEEPLRIGLYVNWRKALRTPLAHQCLVGAVPLEYDKKIRSWPLEKQAVAYRGMTFSRSWDENILASAFAEKKFIRQLLSRSSTQERRDFYNTVSAENSGRYTATVSYVGKANFGAAEKYICDCRSWVCPTSSPCVAEVSAVNGRFVIDLSQSFSGRLLVDALIEGFREQGLHCVLQDCQELELPNVLLPWSADIGNQERM